MFDDGRIDRHDWKSREVNVRFCTWATVLGLAIGFGAGGRAQTQATGVDAIAGYAGVWKTQMDHVDTPYSKKGHEEATLKNDCWKSGAYFACRQIVDGDPKILLVFTCKGQHDCMSYQIPADGSKAGSGKVVLDGKTWMFPWESTEDGKTTYFRVVNVWTSATTIDFRQEFSSDREHWTVMASGHEVKVSEK
jgi:hypothetical protein